MSNKKALEYTVPTTLILSVESAGVCQSSGSSTTATGSTFTDFTAESWTNN